MASEWLTDAEIAEIRKRCEAATKSPWESLDEAATAKLCILNAKLGRVGESVEKYQGARMIHRPPQSRAEAMETFFEGVVIGWMSDEDAEFIAAVRTDLPRLLDEVARLRAAMRRLLNSLEDDADPDEQCDAYDNARKALEGRSDE